jgi:hypothetical protein
VSNIRTIMPPGYDTGCVISQDIGDGSVSGHW